MEKPIYTDSIFYNRELVKRFISDLNLPIPVISMDTFYYHLVLYEYDYESLTRYNELINLIKAQFDGDVEKFLKEYYDTRDNIINAVLENEAYQKFNTADISKYTNKNRQFPKSSIYNNENQNKVFISIDLKKANFQTLKHYDSNIVFNANTYEDFIGKFTDLDYIKESKYTRQVVFGKLNPKRHISMEKYYISLIYDFLKISFPFFNNFCTCVSVTNDEIIFRVDDDSEVAIGCISDMINDGRIAEIVSTLGFDVHVSLFRLFGYNLISEARNKIVTTFFNKEYLDKLDHPFRLKCVPLPYHSLIYKLYKGFRLSDLDYHFAYEGIESKFCDTFHIEPFK